MPRPAINITGRRYGLLTVIQRTGNRQKEAAWQCFCACGGSIIVVGSSLRNGRTRSCGCLRNRGVSRPRHGHSVNGGSGAYKSWVSMKNRCLNPVSAQFDDYGGRGITICERWLIFENFFADMGERPKGLTLDRSDNEGNYEPSNCRWATPEQQNGNRRKVGRLQLRIAELEQEVERLRAAS